METKTNNKGGAKEVAKPNNTTNNTPAKTAEDIIKEQEQYFTGLTEMVYKRARFQEHKEEVEKLDFEKEELAVFEHETYNGCIELKDFKHNTYTIKNPKLVLEIKNYLLGLMNTKITDLEKGIVAFAEKKQ